MDGTAIYFPLCVVFLAVTQGIQLTPVDYVIICLLSTLASIGTTPIPSSSLVLTVMIAGSVSVPITGMYVRCSRPITLSSQLTLPGRACGH